MPALLNQLPRKHAVGEPLAQPDELVRDEDAL